MPDTDTDEVISGAKEIAKQTVGISSNTIDGQTTNFTDGLDAVNAWERRRNRRNGTNPSLCRMSLTDF